LAQIHNFQKVRAAAVSEFVLRFGVGNVSREDRNGQAARV
jgi:hypothetical protein